MRKVYVAVTAEFSLDGQILPKSFTWENGRCYPVDRVLDIRPAPSLKVGGQGTRYTIRVLGRQTHIWLESDQRWFMEAK